ncbi:MAG: hypothetical protein PHU40_00555 [Sulfurimonas sp.]|nr:hypothetical protein [Sulfurimonas sp.]
MIIDKVQNATLYHFGEAWTKAFAFLASLTPESGLYESHREYVDIQSVLVGAERFECELTERLEINDPKDIHPRIFLNTRQSLHSHLLV